MKKMLIAAMAAITLFSCDKENTPFTNEVTNPTNDAMVNLTFIDAHDTRAFFGTTAQAETWEKNLTALTVFVFDNAGTLVTQRNFSTDELTAKSALFALPHAAAGTTCDFYAVANLPITDVSSKAVLLAKLETAAAEYNGTFAEVGTKAKRTQGFVMTGGQNKAVAAQGATTSLTLTLRRTVSKIALQTSLDPGFADKYSGTLTVTSARIVKAASQSPIIAPATPNPGAMTYTHTQAVGSEANKYNNLFYVFENGNLSEGNRVTLEITATYDADGNNATTNDRSEVNYTIPISGASGGAIERNGYYRIAANIKGITGNDVGMSITVADWETPTTQQVDLGA